MRDKAILTWLPILLNAIEKQSQSYGIRCTVFYIRCTSA